jgi:preprotein translocase subunit YajC
MIGASSGGGFFLLIIVAFAFLWFVLIRPQKRRQVQTQQMLNQLSVGDEVVTAGGIYGEITSIDEATDDVMVRIAPSLEVKVARRAIAGVTPPPEPDEPEDPEAPEIPEPETAPEPPTAD